MEMKSDTRLSNLEDQVSYLVKLSNPNILTNQLPPLNDHKLTPSAPAQPSTTPSWGPAMSLPSPPRVDTPGPEHLPPAQLPATHGRSASDAASIRAIIGQARCVVGIGPVTPAHVERMKAETLEEKYTLCAIEYLVGLLNSVV